MADFAVDLPKIGTSTALGGDGRGERRVRRRCKK
jgi:hypothetical protein